MKQFETVPIKKPALNVFNLSHDVKSSYNFDKLYPFLVHPINPGETFNVRAEVFLRTMPLFAPVMHNVDMYFYFFFVPNRLVWNEKRKEDWKTFITGGEKGDFGDHGYKDNPSTDYILPHWNYGQMVDTPYAAHGSLLDHMGFPTVEVFDTDAIESNSEPLSSLPFRAYQLIYNEYFRNQNVQDEIDFSYGSGLETLANIRKLFEFRYKCWEKDYFTSCLPWQQRGEAVQLPLTTGDVSVVAELQGNVVANKFRATTGANTQQMDLKLVPDENSINKHYLGTDAYMTLQNVQNAQLEGTATITSGELRFSGANIGTISDLRYCLRLQQWLENNARCGSRYIEQILAHFGVMSSDSRLQRPELLGGGKIPLIFSDVPQTSSTDQESVQGNLAGKGMLYGKTGGFKKYFEEHGILMGICCMIPRTSYSQGIPRYWRAMDKTDFYFPEFAHLSEQAVLNSEIYYNPCVASPAPTSEDYANGPDGVFGYQGRYTEYRYIPSTIHGEMRAGLQYWHFGRIFDELPRLNSTFVEADSRVNVFAIDDIANGKDDPFVAQIHLDIKAVRPLPKFAVPSL